MANIKITVEGPLMDGHKITFKAPCNCDVVEKLDVRYIENNTQKSKLFTMKDSHGKDLTGLGNLFFKDAYVDVVLDINTSSAYLQNASTNTYLEEKIKFTEAHTPVDNLESDRADLPLSARQGKILNESLEGLKSNEWKKLSVVSGINNPISLPTDFNELYVECRPVVTPSNNTTTMSMFIPKCCLLDTNKDFTTGASRVGSTQLNYFCNVRANKTNISLQLLHVGSTEYTTTATMEVYYK